MAFYHLTLYVLDEDYFRKDTGSLNYGFINSSFKTCVYANRHLLPLKQLKYFYSYRYIFIRSIFNSSR